MHILLVGPDLEENLSLRYLSSSLKEGGHVATIATFDAAADSDAVVARADAADIVGLSLCYQVRAAEFFALARALKARAPSRMVVAGGHYASCAARDILLHRPEIDVIVVHEGERTLVEIASLADRSPEALSRVPGIAFMANGAVVETARRPMFEDLDALPWPDRSGPARLMVGVPSAYMMGSRGCLSACDYCCISTLHRMAPGPRLRQRSVESVADEMAFLYHERGVRQFNFHDDNFLVLDAARNMDRIEALDRATRRRGLRHVGLTLKCRPPEVDRQVFLRLREMGLLRVFLGIESGTAAGLASLGRRRQTVEDEHRALDVCEDLGISTQYTIILFHPEATPETMLEDLAFVRRHPAHPMSFCRAEIYAGTPLERRMVDAGRARGNYLAKVYGYTDARTDVLWRAARRVLLDRCWTPENLMGQVIQTDHLASVFRHFYEGRKVDALASEVGVWQLEVIEDTIGLLEDLIRAYQEHPDLASAALEARVTELSAGARSRGEAFDARGCVLRDAMHEEAFGMVGLPREPQRGGATPVRRPRHGAPGHAAAVLVAVGVLGCGGTIETSGRSPVDAAADRTVDTGAPQESGGSDAGWVHEGGVVEKSPPPMDASADGAADSASPRDARVQDATWVNDGGVLEAPPPPVDGGWVNEGGVVEKSPPPFDAG